MPDEQPAASPPETLIEQHVTYVLELNGQLFVVEHVPARVNPDTGEQFFAPATVERLHRLIRDRAVPPARVVATPVFDYAA